MYDVRGDIMKMSLSYQLLYQECSCHLNIVYTDIIAVILT